MKSLHKYMRAIGFSNMQDRRKLRRLINGIVVDSDRREYTTNEEDIIIAEFSKDFAENMGIAVCGEFDEEDKFSYEYYFPYLRPTNVTSTEEICVERHGCQESYVGICDETRVGVSLIFYVQNMIPYIKLKEITKHPLKNASLSLSALSLNGTILMPIYKNEMVTANIARDTQKRNILINAARNGDTEAMEALALKDMDIYTNVSRKMLKEDIYSLVDTFFMPYGVECDHFAIMAEILECELVKNRITDEEIYRMTVNCNDMIFDLCINKQDLLGEPEVGRRFKGSIWVQGFINYNVN